MHEGQELGRHSTGARGPGGSRHGLHHVQKLKGINFEFCERMPDSGHRFMMFKKHGDEVLIL